MRLAASVLLALLCPSVFAQASLRGTVYDGSGSPVPGAAVKLTCAEASPPLVVAAATDAAGTYHFAALQPCRYQVSAHASTASAVPVPFLVVAAGTAEAHLDLTLVEIAAMPVAAPKFAAAGIRGLIDPGGYSAPANAAAASGLLSNLAEVNRARSAGCYQGPPLAQLEAAHAAHPADLSATLAYADGLLEAQQFAAARDLLAAASPAEGSRVLPLRARAQEGTGDFSGAAASDAALQALHPSEATLFAEGYELILAARLPDAVALFRSGLATWPRSATLRIGAGTAEFLQGHASEAIAQFLVAAENDPADTRPYPFLAAASTIAAAQNGRIAAALERHLALVPGDAAAHLAFASILLHSPEAAQPGTATRAEKELRTALGLDASLAEAHLQLGILLAQRNATEEAAREFQLAVQLDPARREAHYRLAQELRKAGDPEGAGREMQTFQQMRVAATSQGEDVRRYLSVMRAPAGANCSSVMPTP